MVACAARLTGEGPVRIGLPLAGWELAVVDADGDPVADGRDRRAGHRRRRPGPLPRRRPRTPRSSRRCPRSAGSARTAAATWSAPSRRGCCSSAAPTSRSSSAAGGSSWARSTPRCRRCPAWPARPPRCAAPRRATSSWSATSCPRDGASTPAAAAQRLARAAAGRAGAAARRGRHAADPHVRQGRPGRAALAAAHRGDAAPTELTGTAGVARRAAGREILGVRPAEPRTPTSSASGGGSLGRGAAGVAGSGTGTRRCRSSDVYQHPTAGARWRRCSTGSTPTAAVRREVAARRRGGPGSSRRC